MAGGPSMMTLMCMRAARHLLDMRPYAPQVPHAPEKAFGALQIPALTRFPEKWERSQK